MISMTYDEYDRLEEELSSLDYQDPFIPSDEDLAVIQEDPDKYAVFLMWVLVKNGDAMEKSTKNKINRILNGSIVLEEDDG